MFAVGLHERTFKKVGMPGLARREQSDMMTHLESRGTELLQPEPPGSKTQSADVRQEASCTQLAAHKTPVQSIIKNYFDNN